MLEDFFSFDSLLEELSFEPLSFGESFALDFSELDSLEPEFLEEESCGECILPRHRFNPCLIQPPIFVCLDCGNQPLAFERS